MNLLQRGKRRYYKILHKINKFPRVIRVNNSLGYIPIPKVACSSIKTALAYEMGIKIPENEPDMVHKIVVPNFFSKEIRNSNIYIFAFVRNPWDRAVSCYLNRIKHIGCMGGREIVIGNIERNGFNCKNINFIDFVKIISQIPDSKADHHFKSQYTFLTNKKGDIIPNYIGRFENLNSDFDYLRKRFKIKKKLPHLQVGNKNKIHYSNFYNEESKKLITERYAKDIELFNYSF